MKKKLIPIYKEILGDFDTPVSLYLKLNQPQSFLLESVTGGEQVARYSFIGLDPFCSFINDGTKNLIEIEGEKFSNLANPIDELQKLVEKYKFENVDHLPCLIGGAIGFFSWETIFHIEDISRKEKTKTSFPLAQFLFPRSLVVFDHVKRKIIIISLAEAGQEEKANTRIERLEKLIKTPLKNTSSDFDLGPLDDPFKNVSSNYQKEDFIKAVKKVKNHIYEGDIFQLVLSQNFTCKSQKLPFDVYRKLRYINPSPYMFYFNLDDYQLIGSSPEILVRSDDNIAQVRPIAGTRPRRDKNEEKLIEELKNDEKEKAEHIMLLDLGRNDLGRVCEYDTVKTTALMEIEKYSHVLHMSSNVTGKLAKGKTAFDLFKATFPAGTVSGAPKIKAIEIIEGLEPAERGPYAGALGYFDFRGNMDLCIIIRTILAKNKVYSVQAGAGIVADSVPEKEFEETKNKAKGMIEACL
ncbi:anthranilate synthase component I [Candidatus Margulisiibacteriota bacterium]